MAAIRLGSRIFMLGDKVIESHLIKDVTPNTGATTWTWWP